MHAQKKRVAATPYSMGAMQNLSGFVDDTEKLLMEKIDGFAAKDGKFDLGDWLHYFAFDVGLNFLQWLNPFADAEYRYLVKWHFPRSSGFLMQVST